MKEQNYPMWDLLIKVIGLIVTIVTLIHGIDRYTTEQRQISESTIQAKQQERKSAFVIDLFRRDLNTYTAIIETASEIAVFHDDPPRRDQAIKNYEKLYWSSVTMEEDKELANAMDAMRNSIRHFLDGQTAKGEGEEKPEDQLKKAASKVSITTRNAIQRRLKILAEMR